MHDPIFQIIKLAGDIPKIDLLFGIILIYIFYQNLGHSLFSILTTIFAVILMVKIGLEKIYNDFARSLYYIAIILINIYINSRALWEQIITILILR